jgi:WD40 repeat protein
MAPEQMRGEALDARADIFAAGVVLAEMSAPTGIRDRATRESIWQAVRRQSMQSLEGPWRAVLERAVAGERSRRYESARALARALEEVTLRVDGAEDKHPYPGLESFTAADAEFFFGREVEVETVWKKLQRANLLAIIGPSGAGKTSFLQAGLLPARPGGWQHVVLRPGPSPFVALARALAPELAADQEAFDQLLQIEDPAQALAVVGRWRRKHSQALIVVDQFEELFTLGRPEAQAAFAELLGRVAAEADVHVLLVMRDDFLFHCHKHPQLAPISSDLTMLGPPTGSALRRALVQPALLSGYRFEDESLADEMLGAIEGERGALPMLAFTAARLWEQRDRDRGLLTREAYERIGGVSGALAQHAEATLERIGSERQPIVREIFRNLVTAQGTRAAAEVEELLSVFEDRKTASEALQELVNARLLTSFELPDTREDGHERRRVEIVHESLLTNWPRLVRWQTQDTEGAQLRDQLRQAAQLWKERRESQDLLWTGTAFKEFELWRERYAGGLTATEEAFAKAMVARAGRQRRRRRLALVAAFAALLSVTLVIGWYGHKEKQARLSAEASKLLALGRNELEVDPAAALAYAVASLELSDNPTGRQFAIKALSRGPAARVVALDHPTAVLSPVFLGFSPDGKRLAAGGLGGVSVLSQDATPGIVVSDKYSVDVKVQRPQFTPDGEHLVWMSTDDPALVRVRSLSEGKDSRTFRMEGVTLPLVRGNRLYLVTDISGREESIGKVSYPAAQNENPGTWSQTLVRTWAFDDKEPQRLSDWDPGGIPTFDIDARGRWVAYPKGRGVYLAPLDGLESGRERLMGEHSVDASRVRFDPTGDRLASSDVSGEIRLWSLVGDSARPLRVIHGKDPLCGLWFDPAGGMLAAAYASSDKDVRLWDLNGPQDADPVILRRNTSSLFPAVAFSPTQPWIAVAYHGELALWPLAHPAPYVLHGTGGQGCRAVAFTPDGESMIAAFLEGGIRIWSLKGGPTRDLWKPQSGIQDMVLDPRGRFVVVGTFGDGAFLVSMPDGQARRLPDNSPGGCISPVEISPDGRLAAGTRQDGSAGVRVWDLESGGVRVLENSANSYTLAFSGDGRLISCDDDGSIRQWNPKDGRSVELTKGRAYPTDAALSRDGRFLFVGSRTEASAKIPIGSFEAITTDLIEYDLKNHTSRSITTHGNRVCIVTLDPSETRLVTRDWDGVTRVGPITGEEPHLLVGANMAIWGAVSPDGRWVASGDADNPSVQLWRMPEGHPLQTLPHDEFLNRLRALTFFRAVPATTSPTGYRLDRAPFPGWETVPTW